MSNPYSAPETVEPNLDRNVSAENSPTLLARIIRWVALGCLGFIVVRIIFGHGVVGFVSKAALVFFWLFIATMIAIYPRRSGIPVGILMLLSVVSQTYFLRSTAAEFAQAQMQMFVDASGMWKKFYLSLLPMGIGGIASMSLFWLFPKPNNSLRGSR